MAEHGAEIEPAEQVTAADSPGPPDSSGAALATAIALAKGRKAKPDAKLDAFLDTQTRMLELQMEHLHEQRSLQVEHLKQQEKHLRLRYFGDRLRIGLQILGMVAGLAIVIFLGALAWNAHEDHGVSIEAFSVPPDLAQRGLTGQVIATQVLDRLASLQAQTVTSRPASTYANDWGGDIKVEIPETGVSIGELNRYLRQWLGSQTVITGEVVRSPAGLTLTARAGSNPGAPVSGADNDLDKLVQRAAEAVYAQTQPYRYAVYLSTQGRTGEAITAFSRLARTGPAEDRAWAYAGWAALVFQQNRFKESARLAGIAMDLNPRLQAAYPIRGLSLSAEGRDEEDYAHGLRELALLRSGRAIGIPGGSQATPSRIRFMEGAVAAFKGDYLHGARLVGTVDTIAFEGTALGYDPKQYEGQLLASAHDLAAARRAGWNNPGQELVMTEQWGALAQMADELTARAWPPASTGIALLARTYAHVGRLDEAQTAIERTGLDCAVCLTVRGLIAVKRRDWATADRWYAEASRISPSLPFPETDWGRELLNNGDLDGAIARLKEAHRRGPRFADPVSFLGEALMRKGDLAEAIANFEKAGKLAPNWGRNHMMWGEALMLSGRYAEARRQYETANGLDLSKPERAALDVLLARTAKGHLHG
jgi:tetratricopeptide (TPR) repeat protein